LQILNRNALAQETMSPERLFAVKEEMDKAEARRLQPYFVRSFFMKAFAALAGSIYPREAGRFEITHVPSIIHERDRRITGRNRRDQFPVLRRYERVCFTKDAVQPLSVSGSTRAELLHPGHPLMLAMCDLILEQHGNLLRQGTILVDPVDDGDDPYLLFLLTHEISSGDGQTLSKRMQLVRVDATGQASFAGWAPHLDLEVLPAADLPLMEPLLASPWICLDQEQRALALAAERLVPDHFNEVAGRRTAYVDKTLAAVHERLTKEIAFWTDRWVKLKEDLAAGKDVRLNIENARRTIADLEGRLENRKRELQAMRHVQSATPIAVGGALVIPGALLARLRGEAPDPGLFSTDAQARAHIEKMAMDAVRQAEEAQGCTVIDVSAQKCGWDLTSYPPVQDGRQPEPRHIEVKGRAKGASTVTVTRNEILYGLNQQDKFLLAIVLVDGDTCDGPYYVHKPFTQEPDWAVASINLDLTSLLEKAAGGM
ncbi:MAG: DUF3883 domain-containing protein, partial [Proteobacteria bacterium]|nr:DUF3883 domain-containing protein [Pseudomonadota bacterium]